MSGSTTTKFKAGDPLNPYDPASFNLGDEGPAARLDAGTGPASVLSDMMKDPSKMKSFMEMMKADMEDAKRRGETMQERAMREKREWAEADAKSAKLKDEANAAFRKGDFKDAFLMYSTCMEISQHEPLYRLNRAAAALQLKLYTTAVKDASSCVEDNHNVAKAYFRRSQALRYLGKLEEARRDLEKARSMQPKDATLNREEEILTNIESMSKDDLSAWVSEQGGRSTDDLFGEKGLDEWVERKMNEMGANLRHQMMF
ncbi:hypothetical protein PM082_004139 [Marasmius tenuissimus]|nr:hypothetical protein PM082_004139 [Marasmius tenuissimus]